MAADWQVRLRKTWERLGHVILAPFPFKVFIALLATSRRSLLTGLAWRTLTVLVPVTAEASFAWEQKKYSETLTEIKIKCAYFIDQDSIFYVNSRQTRRAAVNGACAPPLTSSQSRCRG